MPHIKITNPPRPAVPRLVYIMLGLNLLLNLVQMVK